MLRFVQAQVARNLVARTKHGRCYLLCDSPKTSRGEVGRFCCAAETHKISPCPPVTQISLAISAAAVI